MKSVAQSRKSHPLIQRLARNILLSANVDSQHHADEAAAIGTYVRDNMRYLRDPQNVEQLQDPVTMINDLSTNTAQGDCDDMALLIATLLLSVGHTPCFRAVRYKGNWGHFDHIYVVDYEKNYGSNRVYRVVLDAIMKQWPIGREVTHKSGAEFPCE